MSKPDPTRKDRFANRRGDVEITPGPASKDRFVWKDGDCKIIDDPASEAEENAMDKDDASKIVWFGIPGKDPAVEHERFLAWRDANRTGRVLNMLTQKKARLHRAKCQHFVYTRGPGVEPHIVNETSNMKICGPDGLLLKRFAAEAGIKVVNCPDC